MAESMKGLKRTHRCTELSAANVGEEVTVMGWVQKNRNKGGIIFVDLRDSFKQEAEKGAQLYYRTDHHWTTEGAYLGYSQLCKSLKIKPTEKSDFKIDTYGGFYGTTYSTSGFWLTKPQSTCVGAFFPFIENKSN